MKKSIFIFKYNSDLKKKILFIAQSYTERIKESEFHYYFVALDQKRGGEINKKKPWNEKRDIIDL